MHGKTGKPMLFLFPSIKADGLPIKMINNISIRRCRCLKIELILEFLLKTLFFYDNGQCIRSLILVIVILLYIILFVYY